MCLTYCVIYTRQGVFHLISKTPRSELKNDAIAEFLNNLQSVWKSDQIRLSDIGSQKNPLFEEKIGFRVIKVLCQLRSRLQTYPNH